MRQKGSITVFLALLMGCLLSCLFAFLEAARVSGLKANVQMCTMQAGDGLAASYQRTLWEDYHLMFWEGQESDFPELAQAGSVQQEIVEGNWERYGFAGRNFYVFPVHLKNVTVTGYQLATDGGGKPFQIQAAEVMKQQVAEETVKEIIEWVSQAGDSQDEAQAVRQEEAAIEALDNLQKKTDSSGAAGSGANSSVPSDNLPAAVSKNGEQTVSENPIQWLKDVRKNGIYSFLMPQEDVSVKKIDLSDSVGRRTLKEGTITEMEQTDVSDKMLFRLYLASCFQDVTAEGEDHALDYEIEYLIAGKASDKGNLTAVINRLLLLREAANLAYLESNPQKQQEALAIAAVLTSAAAQPELAEPVKHGILAAWAYAEALSDVRILLDGGKVSLIKTEEQWHTQLNHLSSSVMENGGKQQQKGLSYEGYMQILLWSVSDKKLSERAMTLIEKDTGVKMDCMVYRMNCSYEYEASALFWKFVYPENTSFSNYCFTDEAAVEYFFNQ